MTRARGPAWAAAFLSRAERLATISSRRSQRHVLGDDPQHTDRARLAAHDHADAVEPPERGAYVVEIEVGVDGDVGVAKGSKSVCAVDHSWRADSATRSSWAWAEAMWSKVPVSG